MRQGVYFHTLVFPNVCAKPVYGRRPRGTTKRRKQQFSDEDESEDDGRDTSAEPNAMSSPVRSVSPRSESGSEDEEKSDADTKEDLGRGARTRAKVRSTVSA